MREAILTELTRQSEEGGARVRPDGEGALMVEGRVDLETLAMAIVGAVAGGP